MKVWKSWIRSGWVYNLNWFRRAYPINVIPISSAASIDKELGDVREMTIEAPMREAFCIISELIRPVVNNIFLSNSIRSSRTFPAILSSVLCRPISSPVIYLAFPSVRQMYAHRQISGTDSCASKSLSTNRVICSNVMVSMIWIGLGQFPLRLVDLRQWM